MITRQACEEERGHTQMMGERTCSPDEAFEHLRRISQTEHRKLRDVAQDLIDQVTPPSPSAGQEP